MRSFNKATSCGRPAPAREQARLATWIMVGFTLGVALYPCPRASAEPDTADAKRPAGLAGHWAGRFENAGVRFPLAFEFRPDERGWAATASSPVWGEQSWALFDIKPDQDRITFHLAEVRGVTGSFEAAWNPKEMRGRFKWRQRDFPFRVCPVQAFPNPGPASRPSKEADHLGSLARGFGLGELLSWGRPSPVVSIVRQLPRLPLDYEERPVQFRSGKTQLSGLLTIPGGKVRHPGLVLLTGSGPHEAQPNVPGPPGEQDYLFYVLADKLTRSGMVTLRLDSRGVGGSGGRFDDATIEDRADDAIAAAEFLHTLAEVDGGAVGLLGHSEGGAVAVLAASRSRTISRLVLLCAPAVPGDQLLLEQTRRMRQLAVRYTGESFTAKKRAEIENIKQSEYARLYDLAKGGLSNDQVREQFLTWLGEEERRRESEVRDPKWYLRRGGDPAERADHIPVPAMSRQAAERRLAEVCTPHLRSYLRYDPRPAIRASHISILAVYGALDPRVAADQNVPEMKRALEFSAHPSSSVRVFPGLDHGLHRVDPDDASELILSTPTDAEGNVVDPAVLELVTKWASGPIGAERSRR